MIVGQFYCILQLIRTAYGYSDAYTVALKSPEQDRFWKFSYKMNALRTCYYYMKYILYKYTINQRHLFVTNETKILKDPRKFSKVFMSLDALVFEIVGLFVLLEKCIVFRKEHTLIIEYHLFHEN